MYKAAVIGDFEDTAYFGAIGIETFFPGSKKDAKKLVGKLSKSGYAVIFISEEYYEGADFQTGFLPAVIPLSFKGEKTERISGLVKRAIGSDMIF